MGVKNNGGKREGAGRPFGTKASHTIESEAMICV